jgi:hypothetical protein
MSEAEILVYQAKNSEAGVQQAQLTSLLEVGACNNASLIMHDDFIQRLLSAALPRQAASQTEAE